jgi:hypothetical protein
MSSSNYETVYEHYGQDSSPVTTTETPESSPPMKKLTKKEKLKAGLKKVASKTKEVAKKGAEVTKKGASAVAKKAKEAAAWMVFYWRLAIFVGFALLAAYLWNTFAK